ncbi:hypothetical protein EN944_34095, partial [Mesorhizobium sp. M7A.F.Ca.US.006.01.2.1]
PGAGRCNAREWLGVSTDRAQLSEIVHRVRHGKSGTNIGIVTALDDAVATFNSRSDVRETRTRVRTCPVSNPIALPT